MSWSAAPNAICGHCCSCGYAGEEEESVCEARIDGFHCEHWSGHEGLTKCANPTRIKSIFLFPNGMLAVCDENGQQLGGFQGRAEPSLCAKIGRQLEKQDADPQYKGCFREQFTHCAKRGWG